MLHRGYQQAQHDLKAKLVDLLRKASEPRQMVSSQHTFMLYSLESEMHLHKIACIKLPLHAHVQKPASHYARHKVGNGAPFVT